MPINDGTLIRQRDEDPETPQTLGWISLGRDTSLEQRILNDIFQRLTKRDSPRGLFGHGK